MTVIAPLGILSAIPEELRHLEDREDGSETIAGLVFHKGRIEGQSAVFVETGIGKVNAALTAPILAQHFRCQALIFGGVAGGIDPELGIGDVVVATKLVQHDYGALVEGRIEAYQPGVPPLPGFDRTPGYHMAPGLRDALRRRLEGIELPAVSAAVTGESARQARLHFGTIVSGDTFVNCGMTRERLAPQGCWAAMKARLSDEERGAVPADVLLDRVEPLQVPGLNAERCIVWMRRASKP